MIDAVPQCAYRKPDGTPCKAKLGKGQQFCFIHDPAKENERREARAKGGKARQGKLDAMLEGALSPDTKQAKLVTWEEIRQLLEETVHHVRTGQLTESRAQAVSQLCRVILATKDAGKFDEKLKKIEERTRPLANLPPEQLVELVKATRDRKAVAAGH